MLHLKLTFSSSLRRHGRGLIGALQFLRLSTSTAAAAIVNPSPTPPLPKIHHLIVDFLVDKLAFSPEKAIKASKHLSTLKSIEKPQSFVGFMRSRGFSDAHIKKMVSFNPRCLLFDADKTIAPKLQSLKDTGFSDSDIIRLVNSNHRLLNLDFNRNLLPRIQFWQDLVGSRDRLIKLLKSNYRFLTYNVDKNVMLNISFLRGCGVSDERISLMARQDPSLIIQRPQSLRAVAERAEKEMGIARTSGMFVWALRVLVHISKDKFNATLSLMKGFGWSEAEFLSAFRKAPLFLALSREILARKMEFLLKDAGCEPPYVAKNPVLLMLSLEKRLVPRHHIMDILMSRGLLTRECKVATFMSYSEKMFAHRFVHRYSEEVPELQDMYVSGSGYVAGHGP